MRAGDRAIDRKLASSNPKCRHHRRRGRGTGDVAVAVRQQHSNTWDLRKTIDLAFKEIGYMDSRSKARSGEVGFVHGGLANQFRELVVVRSGGVLGLPQYWALLCLLRRVWAV